MGAALGAYRRYRELPQSGASGRLTEVVDERWIENCVGLTGWTMGLDIATANFAAGIARAFPEMLTERARRSRERRHCDHPESGDRHPQRSVSWHAADQKARGVGFCGLVSSRGRWANQLAFFRDRLELRAPATVGRRARPSRHTATARSSGRAQRSTLRPHWIRIGSPTGGDVRDVNDGDWSRPRWNGRVRRSYGGANSRGCVNWELQ